LQPRFLLPLDQALDFAVLHRLELCGADLAFRALLARFLERVGTQKASHMIGSERRLGAFHDAAPTATLAASNSNAVLIAPPDGS
jgi:hypothetical protein